MPTPRKFERGWPERLPLPRPQLRRRRPSGSETAVGLILIGNLYSCEPRFLTEEFTPEFHQLWSDTWCKFSVASASFYIWVQLISGQWPWRHWSDFLSERSVAVDQSSSRPYWCTWRTYRQRKPW